MPVTRDNFTTVFTYHAPNDTQIDQLRAIRAAALALVDVILTNTPISADQQAAIRHVREAVMTANAAIVLKGAV